MKQSVVVVGAGLAGLVCARRLHQAGVEVTVVEKSASVGGRLQTKEVDGFQLDFGSETFSQAFPNCRLEFNYSELNLNSFEPGYLIWTGKGLSRVHADEPIDMMFARKKQLHTADIFRANQMFEEIKKMGEREVWHVDDISIMDYLRQKNFSDESLEDYFEPVVSTFLHGRELNESCRTMLFNLKALLVDRSLPDGGLGVFADQVMLDISWDKFLMEREVTEILEEDGRVTGVKLCDGQVLQCDFVVLATNARDAKRLSGVPMNDKYHSSTCVNFAVPEMPVDGPMIITNESGGGRVNHLVPTSLLRKSASPDSRGVMTSVQLKSSGIDDVDLAHSVRYELKDWFPEFDVDSWKPLAVHRTECAYWDQPVGFGEHLTPIQPKPGLVIANESTCYAGIDGLVRAGQDASVAVMTSVEEKANA